MNSTIMHESEHSITMMTPGEKKINSSRHRVIERKLKVKPEMVVVNGRIYYDYTEIIIYAWQTGQEAKIKRT